MFQLVVATANATPQPVDEALPMVGTAGHGHTYPGATVPFGFVQLSPDTRTQGWDACSGYHYSDTNILGFSHTHLSGTGGIDLGELLILPVTGKLNDSDRLHAVGLRNSSNPVFPTKKNWRSRVITACGLIATMCWRN